MEKKIIIFKIKKFVSRLLIAYLIYLLFFGIVIYAFPKNVNKEYKENYSVERFYSDDIGVDRVALVETPSEAFDWRIKLLRDAEETLDITYFCFKKGDTTKYFISEVIACADRGVKVRIIVDGKMSGLKRKLKDIKLIFKDHKNIEFKVYNPLNLLKPWEFNIILHDKFLIVDDKLVILGGRNIGDEYFAPPEFKGKVANDRDIVVFNTAYGTANADKSGIFEVKEYMEKVWAESELKYPNKKLSKSKAKKASEMKRHLESMSADLISKRPDLIIESDDVLKEQTFSANKVSLSANPLTKWKKEPLIGYDLAMLANKSADSITIQSPYVVTNKTMMKYLKEAGKDVEELKILTNSLASSPNVPAFSYYNSTRHKLINENYKIYEYQGSDSIHAKTFVFDNRVSAIGSFNFDERSMYIDTESMLVIDSAEFCEELNKAMNKYFDKSLEVGENNKYVSNENVDKQEISFLKTLLFGFASLVTIFFSYLL